MVHGVVAGARVEGGGVGQEGLGAGFADFVHHDAHELGIEMGVVAHLAKVQLHGAGLALDHAVLEAHQGQQARHFGLLGLVVAATGHGVEVDGGSHVVSLACRWHWGVPWSAPRPGAGLCPLGEVCQIRGKSKYFPRISRDSRASGSLPCQRQEKNRPSPSGAQANAGTWGLRAPASLPLPSASGKAAPCRPEPPRTAPGQPGQGLQVQVEGHCLQS